MKDKCLNLVNSLISEYPHFKKKKNFVNLVENLHFELFKKEYVVLNLIKEAKTKINDMNSEEDEVIMKKIKNKMEYFVMMNEKDYLKMTITENYTVKEYENFYIMYINNKKIDIKKTIENVFLDKEIVSITIDSVVRKNIEKITKDDVLMANDIKIKINK